MIVTLTPNPSLDRTIEIPELHRGEVHRATGGRVDPGGKGVNVSRALAANDVATVTVLPSGGPEGAQLAEPRIGIAVGAAGARDAHVPHVQAHTYGVKVAGVQNVQ